MAKTLAEGRKKAVNTKTYATGRKRHENVPTIQTGRSRITSMNGKPSKTLNILNHLKKHGVKSNHIVEEKIIDSSKSQKKNTTPGDDEAKNDKTNEIKTIKKYTLQPVGPKLPLIHLVEWSDTYEYCAVASGDHVHVFRNLPKFRHCTTIPLAMGGPGTSIHLSSAIEGYQCRSMLWYNQALFLLTNDNIYLTFPFNKMNGGNISLIVLAAREVANVLEEKDELDFMGFPKLNSRDWHVYKNKIKRCNYKNLT